MAAARTAYWTKDHWHLLYIRIYIRKQLLLHTLPTPNGNVRLNWLHQAEADMQFHGRTIYCIRLPFKYLLTMIVSSERYRLSYFIGGPVSQLRFTIASNLLLLIITQVCATCLRAFVCIGASPSAPARQVLQYDYVWHVIRDQYVEKS